MALPASTRFKNPYGTLELHRYPARQQESLQAWCAADLLLLEACHEQDLTAAATGIANDDHGALSLSLQPAWSWTDSALAAIAIERNQQRNGLPGVNLVWSTELPLTPVTAVLLRIPKQLAFFEYQLQQLATLLPRDTLLLAAGMDKHLSPHTAKLIEQYFGSTTRHPGRRKARLFSARRGDQAATRPTRWAGYECGAAGGQLQALPNVFSRDSLDIGSRFLLEQLQRLQPVQSCTDLACGNGVLGIAALRAGLCRELSFCDESAMAIASARHNCGRLQPTTDDILYHHGDGLLGLQQPQDLILCNPPFHLGHTVDDYAGRRLLASCAQQLSVGGSLCLVANRHLDYRPTLQRHFQRVEQLAANRKFVVWQAFRG